jgi:hypothetical protein
MRSRIEPMKKIARMLRVHGDLILNDFKAQKEFSSGVVGGLNNKAKVAMRKSYGFRTFRITELALYHSLGKLPEPEPTHEFFWRVSFFSCSLLGVACGHAFYRFPVLFVRRANRIVLPLR